MHVHRRAYTIYIQKKKCLIHSSVVYITFVVRQPSSVLVRPSKPKLHALEKNTFCSPVVQNIVRVELEIMQDTEEGEKAWLY